MLYIVRFTDRPDRGATRKEFLHAHLTWLDKHQETIRVAGSLRPDPGADALGGLWVVEAEDKQAIEALIQTDPFWMQGLRQGYEILHWSKAFPERRALI